MNAAWVYIVTNCPNGILYTGVTSEGIVPGFTKQYGLNRLVYVESHPDIETAIQRERNMKHWPRT
jgi:putative endonuclease